jgi:hypothetical protein
MLCDRYSKFSKYFHIKNGLISKFLIEYATSVDINSLYFEKFLVLFRFEDKVPELFFSLRKIIPYVQVNVAGYCEVMKTVKKIHGYYEYQNCVINI